MTIAEKIKCSADKAVFTLFREGLFYKCYNEDAMVFAQKVKAYKVSSKYVKSIDEKVISLGFPASEVDKGNISLDAIAEIVFAESYKEDSHGVVFSLKTDIKQKFDDFQTKMTTAREPDAKKVSNNDDAGIHKLVKMIQEYDLANNTPMQGLAFIQELKNQIKSKG